MIPGAAKPTAGSSWQIRSSCGQGCSRCTKCDADDDAAMMMLQQARIRAKAAQDRAKASQDRVKDSNKDDLETEKEKDATQKEVEDLQRVLEPKRARTHPVTADDDEECAKQSWVDWDLTDYRREATHIQNRRCVPLGSRDDVPPPRGSSKRMRSCCKRMCQDSRSKSGRRMLTHHGHLCL